MDNFKLLSIIAVRKTAINKEMYAQIKANSRTETQYDIVERINAVLEASRDVSEGYGAKKKAGGTHCSKSNFRQLSK